MKSTFFKEYFDEVILEVNDTYLGTINKLRAQQGICSEDDGSGDYLRFTCTQKGKLRVDRVDTEASRRPRNQYTYRTYYVEGKVVEASGKTLVKIYSVFDKWRFFFRYSMWSMFLVFAVIYAILRISGGLPFSQQDILFCAVYGVLLAFGYFINRKQNERSDLDLMKNQVIKRVENIKRWDE